jgi:hypothetical protein
MALPGCPRRPKGRLMTYTYRTPAAGPDSVSISPLHGGGDRAYTYGNLTGITYHLMNPCSSYLCLTETYHLQKYYLLDFCNGDLLQRGWGYLCLQKVVITLYSTFFISSEDPVNSYSILIYYKFFSARPVLFETPVILRLIYL